MNFSAYKNVTFGLLKLLKTNYLKLPKIFIQMNTPIIRTKNGLVQGHTLTSRSGVKFSAFLGIPYAKRPERFKRSQPAENWIGIRDSTDFGPRSIQRDILGIRGSEDSLYLNIYTPVDLVKTNFELLPVLFFIHGGGFMFGAGSEYGARILMDKSNVILVTINYRLGVFGFMHTSDGNIEGNLGLKDQVLGLKWVQDNISKFGGDPNKVCIFGESAGSKNLKISNTKNIFEILTGSACCHYHILSPMSKGLFQSAILQSGTALSPWALMQNPDENIRMLAKALKHTWRDKDEFITYLRKLEAKKIAAQSHDLVLIYRAVRAEHVRRSSKIKKMKTVRKFPITFAPSIEIEPNFEKFLPKSPFDIIKSGEFNQVPIIMGCNSNEGLLFAGPYLMSDEDDLDFDQNWHRWAPRALYFKHTPGQKSLNEISQKIREFYLGSQKFTKRTTSALSDIYSDRFFLQPTKLAALLHLNATQDLSKNPIYLYLFGYESQISITDLMAVSSEYKKGPSHFDEVPFILETPYIDSDFVSGSSSELISNKMVSFWTNFATFNAPEKDNCTWTPLDKSLQPDLKWYWIDEKCEMIPHPYEERLKFWESLDLRPNSSIDPGKMVKSKL